MKPSKNLLPPLLTIGATMVVVGALLYYEGFEGITQPSEWGGSVEGYINFLAFFLVFIPISFFALVLIRFGSLLGENYYKKNIIDLVKNEFQHDVLEKEYIDGLPEQSKDFLNAPFTTLLYVDSLEVDALYSLYFDESTVTGITNEIFGESSHELGATVPSIGGAKIGNKGSSKTVQSIKPAELTIAKKFFRLKRILILRQQIVTGLELVDVDISQYSNMKSILSNLRKEYGLHLEKSQSEIDEVSKTLLRDAAKGIVRRLESAKELTLIDGKFKVSSENEKYIFTYDHPVNAYLSSKKNEITIKFTLPVESLSNSQSDFSQLVGKLIPLKVFAKILLPLDSKSESWDVVVKPIAVY